MTHKYRFASLLVMIGSLTISLPAANASTILTFDEFAHATPLSAEFASMGVILASTAPLGASLSEDPADSLQPGQSVAPFVFAIVAVPSASTPTAPNKVIGAVFDVGGGLLQCPRCGIRISFLDPIPRDVSLYITDADPGQSVQFFGPAGLLSTVLLAPPLSGFEFAGLSDAGGIEQVVLTSAPAVGIGFDNLQFGNPVPEPATGFLLAFGIGGLAAAARWRAH